MIEARGVRLHGWQRIGIVAAILWALGAGGWAWNGAVERAGRQAEAGFTICKSIEDDKATGRDYAPCYERIHEAWDLSWEADPPWVSAAGAAFLPPLLFWAGVHIVVALYRWVRRGFAR